MSRRQLPVHPDMLDEDVGELMELMRHQNPSMVAQQLGPMVPTPNPAMMSRRVAEFRRQILIDMLNEFGYTHLAFQCPWCQRTYRILFQPGQFYAECTRERTFFGNPRKLYIDIDNEGNVHINKE